MEQLTLEQAAEANANGWLIPTVGALKGSFKKGAEWQKEQDKELLVALKQIACWPGNLDDTRLTSKTGANDAVARGLLVVHMRTVALLAIKKIEPDYEPFK